VVGFADGPGQFQRGQVFCPLQIFAGDGGNAVSALGNVEVGALRHNNGGWRRGLGLFGGVGFHLHQMDGVRILNCGGSWTKKAEASQGQPEDEGSEAGSGESGC